MNPNGYNIYQKNKVMTASPAELTLMLYEGAIKFCNIAIVGAENKDIEKTHVNIRKIQNIIAELQCTLNRKYPVSKDFDNVYNYLMDRLQDANISKDPEDLNEILGHLRTMRDTWKEVMRITNNGANVKVGSGVA